MTEPLSAAEDPVVSAGPRTEAGKRLLRWLAMPADLTDETTALVLAIEAEAALRAAPEPPRDACMDCGKAEAALRAAPEPPRDSGYPHTDPECYGKDDPRCGSHNCTCACHRAAPEPPLGITTVPFADRIVCGAVTSDGRFTCARRRGHEGPHTDADNLDDEEWRTFAAAPEPPREPPIVPYPGYFSALPSTPAEPGLLREALDPVILHRVLWNVMGWPTRRLDVPAPPHGYVAPFSPGLVSGDIDNPEWADLARAIAAEYAALSESGKGETE